MKKKKDDFAFNYEYERIEKKYVNISICKSNISKEKSSYYARLCKKSTIDGSSLLAMLKKTHPYIDVNMLEMGIKSLIDKIVDLVMEGHIVDFFSLGSFSIKPQGQLQLTNEAIQYMEEKSEDVRDKKQDKIASFLESKDRILGDEDVSAFLLKKPSFSLCFTPSNIAKKTIKDVDVGFAIKKNKEPYIKEIESIEAPGTSSSIVRIKGDGLKVVGNDDNVGLYIRKEGDDEWVKIKDNNILHNTPKDIMFILDNNIKTKAKDKGNILYDVFIATKYVRMGTYNIGKKTRICKKLHSSLLRL